MMTQGQTTGTDTEADDTYQIVFVPEGLAARPGDIPVLSKVNLAKKWTPVLCSHSHVKRQRGRGPTNHPQSPQYAIIHIEMMSGIQT